AGQDCACWQQPRRRAHRPPPRQRTPGKTCRRRATLAGRRARCGRESIDFAHGTHLARRVHRLPRITVSTEANLTSHLSISYSAASTASGPTAPANGTAAPGNTTGTSGDGMAGFLAALVDQLLAGGAATA